MAHGVLTTAALTLTSQALAGAGLAAVSIPIAIHLLTRLRRRPRQWGAMRFVSEVHRRYRQRFRLEQFILLAVRCLIPLILGLALSGPMLSGCADGAGQWLGQAAYDGRMVCIVLDDSLSTQATDAAGQSRFTSLRETALKIVDELTAADRVAVWRATRPGQHVVRVSTNDHAAVRQAIRSIKPRYSRCNLIDTLSAVDEMLIQQNTDPDRTFMVLVSDFAHDTFAVDRPAPRELIQLGQRAKLVVARPMPAVTNTQIAGLTPRRALILPGSDDPKPTVAVEVRLRRFVDTGSPGHTRVELAVFDRDATSPVSIVRQDHTWAVGQSQAVLHATAVLDLAAVYHGATGVSTASNRALSVRARIEPADAIAHSDRLAADDERWATVGIHDKLRVGLIGALSASRVDTSEQGLTAAQWLHLALAPHAVSGTSSPGPTQSALGWGTVAITPLSPTGLDSDTSKALDAVFVSRPDLLSKPQWTHLQRFVERGGLLWVCVPSDSQPAVWGEGMCDQLGLDWRLSIEPRESDPGQLSSVSDKSLATDTPVPQPLNLLGADWQALLAPVRVTKNFELHARGSASTSGEVWLATADGEPLMVSQRLGDGAVVLLATAIDPAWTNLPTKPLFVPLLHETLRGVLGRPSGTGRLQEVVSGDAPVLGRRWEGAKQLALADTTAKGADTVIDLHQTDLGLEPDTPLDAPGIYTATPSDIELALAVNPDPQGGDTRAIDSEKLGQWLSSVSSWQWLDVSDPGQSLAIQMTRTSLGWPLLCILMGVVVIEMLLARWFSHASIPGRGLIAQTIEALRGRGHRVQQV